MIVLLVSAVKSLIREESQKNKTKEYINHLISNVLFEQVGTFNIKYFNEYYFRPLTEKTITQYIRAVGIAEDIDNIEKYELKRLIKEPKLEETKKYMVAYNYQFDRDNLESLSSTEENDEIVVIEAKTPKEATEKFLDIEYEFFPREIIKEKIFHHFWICTAYGDDEYFAKLKNEKITEIKKEIESYTEKWEKDPEKLYFMTETQNLEEEFWKCLTPRNRKDIFFRFSVSDVCCIAIQDYNQWAQKRRNNLKNIIKDITEQDILFWNYVLALIRKNIQDKYEITAQDIMDYGYEDKEAIELFNYAKISLNKVINIEDNEGFIVVRLANIQHINSNTVEIKPLEILYNLASSNYDFNDGANKIALTIINNNSNRV